MKPVKRFKLSAAAMAACVILAITGSIVMGALIRQGYLDQTAGKLASLLAIAGICLIGFPIEYQYWLRHGWTKEDLRKKYLRSSLISAAALLILGLAMLFCQRLVNTYGEQYASWQMLPRYKRNVSGWEARNQEIDGMFLSLDTNKARGILTEQRFMKLPAALEQEQESNQKHLHDLVIMQSRAVAQESEVRTFIKGIWRYATIEELDEAVLNRLISRILIGEAKKVDGQKVQEVRIVYNIVGEIPVTVG